MADRSSVAKLSSGRVRYSVWSVAWAEIKHAARYVVLAAVLSIIIYLCVASTVGRYISVPDFGWVYTSNPDPEKLNRGVDIVFDKDKKDGPSDAETITGRLVLTALPPSGISTGRVIAGPTGQLLRDRHGRVRIKGVDTGLKGKDVGGYLVDQYVVECTGGACGSRGSLIIPAAAVDGIIVGKDR